MVVFALSSSFPSVLRTYFKGYGPDGALLMLEGLVQIVYCPACLMILIRGWAHVGDLQQEEADGHMAIHLGGMQHVGLEQGEAQGERAHVCAHMEQSPVFKQLCCSILLRTGHEMCPGRQPHRNCKECEQLPITI